LNCRVLGGLHDTTPHKWRSGTPREEYSQARLLATRRLQKESRQTAVSSTVETNALMHVILENGVIYANQTARTLSTAAKLVSLRVRCVAERVP
jgi:hypothetical protein